MNWQSNFNIGRFEWSLLYVRINVRWNWRKDEKNQSAPQEIYDSQRCSWWRFNPRDKRKRKYFEPGLEWGIHNVSSVVLSTCLDTRQPGNVFKKLDTRQSEILTNFLEIARLIPLRT